MDVVDGEIGGQNRLSADVDGHAREPTLALEMSRYRFARRPKWILSHVLIALLVVVMINLGFWQIRRLHERQASNHRIEANASLPMAPVDELSHPGDPYSNANGNAYRKVTVTGEYDATNEIIVRSRSLDGRPGVWVATPLMLADGNAVMVVRGFLPTPGVLDAVPENAKPPTGPVTVTGSIQETQTRGLFGPTDPSTGRLTDMARVDVERMQKQLPYTVLPVWVQLETQQPPQSGPEPELLKQPVLTDGPHLSYAVQWFIFSLIAILGYPMILRRSARNEELKVTAATSEDATSDDDVTPPEPATTGAGSPAPR
jgi:cytochrome oxidase assembly protein ShyY1